MDKIEIMPQVVVYRNILKEEDVDYIYKLIKDSQTEEVNPDGSDPDLSSYLDFHGKQPEYQNDGKTIFSWVPWYTYGIKSEWYYHPKFKNVDEEQLKGYNLLIDAITKAHNFYVSEWAEKGKWTYPIKDWKLKGTDDEDSVNLSAIEILQHKLNQQEEYTIKVHTDWHNNRPDEPGPKQLITYTIYLNDDYEGGEVDFVDEDKSEVIVYKPKKGDITVFPAGQPYWHGAKAVKSEPPKIFIRTFSLYLYGGSEEWNRGARTMGAQRWNRMEEERVKEFTNTGEVGRQLVYEGQVENKSMNMKPIFVKNIRYVDGREL